MSEYFPELNSSKARVKVELDLPNYAIKADLKSAAGVNTSKFTQKLDLANLKPDAEKLDVDKLKNVPTNLRNLKSREDKLGVEKLVTVCANLSKRCVVLKNDVKKDIYKATIKNIEYKTPI